LGDAIEYRMFAAFPVSAMTLGTRACKVRLMKTRWLVAVSLAFACFVTPGPAQDEQRAQQDAAYKKLMQAAGAATASIKKNIESDLTAVGSSAGKLIEVFDEVETYWINRDLEEPQTFAQDVMDAAEELAEAASMGDKATAQASFRSLTTVCTQCHNTYREELPGGGYRIK
jgi:cytochrome c556